MSEDERKQRLVELREDLEDQSMKLVMELVNTEVREDVLDILRGIEDAYLNLSIDNNEWTLFPYWFRDEAINLAKMSVDEISQELEAHEMRQHRLKVVLSHKVKETRARQKACWEMLDKAKKRMTPEELEEWREKKGAYDRVVTRMDGKARKSKAPKKSKVRKEASPKDKFDYLRTTLGLSVEDAKRESGWSG